MSKLKFIKPQKQLPLLLCQADVRGHVTHTYEILRITVRRTSHMLYTPLHKKPITIMTEQHKLQIRYGTRLNKIKLVERV